MRDDDNTEDQAALICTLAHLYRASGYTGRALIMLLVAYDLAPDDRNVQANLAYALLLDGKPQQALTMVKRSLSQTPSLEDATHLLHARILWALNRRDEARATFRQFAAARRSERPQSGKAA